MHRHPANSKQLAARFGLACAVLLVGGCLLPVQVPEVHDDELLAYKSVLDVEYPDLLEAAVTIDPGDAVPLQLDTDLPEPRPISLPEAIQRALANSDAMRDLGAVVLQSPDASGSVFDPALQHLDPRFGVDAALSAFDASFAARAFFENNDRAINNSFFGGGTRILKQDLADFSFELSKRAATGGDLRVRKGIDYDANNAPGNVFPSAWNTVLEAEFRQPLFQGAGETFNRIAGPDAPPGVYNGVLIARVNTDISMADFEMSVRNLVSDVEDAYWELYYAYRDLDAKLACRDRALKTWQTIDTWKQFGQPGGDAEFEAQAREQYERFKADVQTALLGSPLEKSRTASFRGYGGVLANERRLRMLMGVPINDGQLLRPADEPPESMVKFEWTEILSEALTRRSELRRQQWKIKQRELELLASRNHLLPRIDAVGRYRWRGFGKDLIATDRDGRDTFDNAYMNLTTGDFQEWQLGVEMTLPVGMRQAFTAVRHAELMLARERARLKQQEEIIVHDLSTAFSAVSGSYQIMRTLYERRRAALDQLRALEAKEPESSALPLHIKLVLDAQRRFCEADSAYYRSLAEYAWAIKQLHYQKGSLLDYNQVLLSESDWPLAAARDATETELLKRRAPLVERWVKKISPDVAQ